MRCGTPTYHHTVHLFFVTQIPLQSLGAVPLTAGMDAYLTYLQGCVPISCIVLLRLGAGTDTAAEPADCPDYDAASKTDRATGLIGSTLSAIVRLTSDKSTLVT